MRIRSGCWLVNLSETGIAIRTRVTATRIDGTGLFRMNFMTASHCGAWSRIAEQRKDFYDLSTLKNDIRIL